MILSLLKYFKIDYGKYNSSQNQLEKIGGKDVTYYFLNLGMKNTF